LNFITSAQEKKEGREKLGSSQCALEKGFRAHCCEIIEKAQSEGKKELYVWGGGEGYIILGEKNLQLSRRGPQRSPGKKEFLFHRGGKRTGKKINH